MWGLLFYTLLLLLFIVYPPFLYLSNQSLSKQLLKYRNRQLYVIEDGMPTALGPWLSIEERG
jgi:hypothetical protein